MDGNVETTIFDVEIGNHPIENNQFYNGCLEFQAGIIGFLKGGGDSPNLLQCSLRFPNLQKDILRVPQLPPSPWTPPLKKPIKEVEKPFIQCFFPNKHKTTLL